MARVRRVREVEETMDASHAWGMALESGFEVERISVSLERSLDILSEELELRSALAMEGRMDEQTQRLLAIMGRMAVAGTSYKGERLIPSCESYSDLAVSLEEQAEAQLQQTDSAFNDLFTAISTWFDKTILWFRGREGKIQQLQGKLKELKQLGYTTLPSITVADRPLFSPKKFGDTVLHGSDDHITSISDLTHNLTEMNQFSSNVLEVVKAKSGVLYENKYRIGVIMDILKVKQTTLKLYGALEEYMKALIGVKGIKASKESGTGGNKLYAAPLHPTATGMLISLPVKTDWDEEEYRKMAYASKRFNVILARDSGAVTENVGKYTFENTSITDMEKLIDAVMRNHATLEGFLYHFRSEFKKAASVVVALRHERSKYIPQHYITGMLLEWITVSYKVLHSMVDVVYKTIMHADNINNSAISDTIDFAHTVLWHKGWQQ